MENENYEYAVYQTTRHTGVEVGVYGEAAEAIEAAEAVAAESLGQLAAGGLIQHDAADDVSIYQRPTVAALKSAGVDLDDLEDLEEFFAVVTKTYEFFDDDGERTHRYVWAGGVDRADVK